MIHAFLCSLCFWITQCCASQTPDAIEQPLHTHFNFYDYRTGEKVIEIKRKNENESFRISYNKTSIPKLAENFINKVTECVSTQNQNTSYYKDSLNRIRSYFIDVYLLLRTNRPSQIEQLIKISQNIDIASSRFFTEMGKPSMKVQNWNFYCSDKKL